MRRFRNLVSLAALMTSFCFYSDFVYADKAEDKIKLGDPLPANLFVELAKVMNPTVVSIATVLSPRQLRQNPMMNDPLFEFFFRDMQPPRNRQRPSPEMSRPQPVGTGFIIRSNGLIMTNNHVIENLDVIKVQLSTELNKYYDAKVVGHDRRTDVALIQIKAPKPLPVAELGSSKEMQVGEWVAAFGNPFGHTYTMTKGIISAKGRAIDELNKIPFLQTDASINPGNSGGPLVNTKGKVIGVNTAIDARAQGIGFAIPIDEVKGIVDQLIATGRVRRGFLGVGLMYVTPEAASALGLSSLEGALVRDVDPKSSAAKSGLQEADVIIKYNDKDIKTPDDLVRAVEDTNMDQRVSLSYIRNGKIRTTTTTLTDRPEQPRASREANQLKQYVGQKAPYDLGFKMIDNTGKAREDFGLPKSTDGGAIVIELEAGSLALKSGLRVGDVIVSVNRKPVRNAREVIASLTGDLNTILVARNDGRELIFIRPEK